MVLFSGASSHVTKLQVIFIHLRVWLILMVHVTRVIELHKNTPKICHKFITHYGIGAEYGNASHGRYFFIFLLSNSYKKYIILICSETFSYTVKAWKTWKLQRSFNHQFQVALQREAHLRCMWLLQDDVNEERLHSKIQQCLASNNLHSPTPNAISKLCGKQNFC